MSIGLIVIKFGTDSWSPEDNDFDDSLALSATIQITS